MQCCTLLYTRMLCGITTHVNSCIRYSARMQVDVKSTTFSASVLCSIRSHASSGLMPADVVESAVQLTVKPKMGSASIRCSITSHASSGLMPSMESVMQLTVKPNIFSVSVLCRTMSHALPSCYLLQKLDQFEVSNETLNQGLMPADVT